MNLLWTLLGIIIVGAGAYLLYRSSKSVYIKTENLLWTLLGIIIVGAGAYLLYRSSKAVSIKTEKVDKLTMSKVLQWFESDEDKSELLKNPNLIAVVSRGEELKKYIKNLKQEGQDTVILVGLFNNAKGEIEKGQLFICNSIDQELIDLFGDKDLIVLK